MITLVRFNDGSGLRARYSVLDSSDIEILSSPRPPTLPTYLQPGEEEL